MDTPQAKLPFTRGLLALASTAVLALAACAPQAAAPTAAPAKPAPPATTTPAKPAPTTAPAKAEAPPAKPAPTAAPAARPTEKPAAKPAAFDEKAIADFYRGKTVRIVVGYSPGGPYDIFSRVLAKHVRRFIPGDPNVIVENKPGAASLLVANQVYGSEAKDGTVIGSFSSGAALLQALGKPGVEFDATRYNWLGSAGKTISTCAARVDSGITSLNDVLGPNAKQLVLASIGPGVGGHDTPTVLKAVLGANFKIVSGYPGTAEMVSAIERKETDGMCGNLDSMQSAVSRLLDGPNPTMKFILVMGATTPDHPWLKGVPAVEPLAKTEDDKQILRAVASSAAMNLPYALAPEVPRERVEALRKALMDTFADAQLRADADKAGFAIDANSGEQVAAIVNDTLKMQPATLARLRDILK